MDGDKNFKAVHLKDLYPPDITDIEWIRKLGEEGNWVIISGDTQISERLHEREVWRQAGLTTIFLAKGWMNQGIWDQAWRLVGWWPAIVDMAGRVSPGAAFEIPVNYGRGKFKQR